MCGRPNVLMDGQADHDWMLPAGFATRVEPAPGSLTDGARIPDFVLPVADGRDLAFREFACGRPLLVACLPDGVGGAAAGAFAAALRTLLDPAALQVVVLCSEADGDVVASDEHLAVAIDAGGRVRARFAGAGQPGPTLVLADAGLRVIARLALASIDMADARVREGIEGIAAGLVGRWAREAARRGGVAPVLLVPDVLDTATCARLIERFPDWGPHDSPMPVGARGALAVDPLRKRREDVLIGDPALESQVMDAIVARLLPELFHAFDFEAGGMERLKLVRYRASARGHFATHRDNSCAATAHRRFALSLNLNAAQHRGGGLAFPEYGEGSSYAPPTGGALVFACALAHRVLPVEAGERYALVSFFSGRRSGG